MGDYNNYNYPQSSGYCTASLVLGIVGLFLNPLYVCVILAIVFGIIGLNQTPEPSNRGMALAGLIIGSIACFLQIIVDICLLPFTFGASCCF